ncbi:MULTISPECIES: GntR family transcriptional regulator [unclassified Paenibacillus]|uniref:GntR family transcriptional regulator n=1 Tax=unclassified Paenibacillus TaxID=185978 RepID=UPI000955EDD9|nr:MULTISPECIES: GntR family transcriptional regulator [unclassified Paenibacillus]ASS65797.1 LacI family transcriptional regulator [Paenibacillus sp. RUD330]SIQ23428.1 GntR family transcriptional regulator, arabinose operon transcriptional repressor [Paenibacillus sp. RU4X]SIQ45035.1 GntR family transcriptional regulator, arabinose operon transcriptional repressor [Paenibacillus sp. RU4T]
MSSTDRTPLYQKIQDYIRDLVDSNELKEGERIPTEKELMERFNVSKITVVNALSGLAAEKLITRVPGRGSFVSGRQPEEAAPDAPLLQPGAAAAPERGAGRRRSGLIGLVMPSIDDYFAIRLIDGVRMALEDKGYRSVILLSGGQVDQEKEAIKTLKEIGAEGLLIFPVDEEQYNEEILAMKFSGFPFVLIDRYLPGVETNYIAADGRMGTSLAVDHLWELGHREIAICSDSPMQTVTVQERLEGYMNELKNKGALINPAHMITGFRVESLKQAETHPLFRYIRNRMATAYITLNGRLAVQIYQMALQAGLRVPEDLSIVSFDDPTSIVEEFSMFTHIRQFEFDMGSRAADKLLEVIGKGGAGGGYTKTLLEPELVVRQTTSGPPL